MISCTDFIGSYSELFTYLEDHYGHDEVKRFWTYLFEPDGKGIPLIHFVREKGLRGCWEYWSGTLKEEAADVDMYLNEKQGWIFSTMLYCPSKGRLLELKKTTDIIPYYDYCGHCDYYRSAFEKVGLRWIRNHINVDQASCSSVLFDPQILDAPMVMDDNTEVLRYRAKELPYFHRDFHSSLNMGIEYLGKVHGKEALEEYLELYTKHAYAKRFRGKENQGLSEIETFIRETYEKERASEVLNLKKTDSELHVHVDYCPAVRHLHETGRTVSFWFPFTTTVVMQTLADMLKVQFTMERYIEETGEADYNFRQE